MKIAQVMTPCPYHVLGSSDVDHALEMMGIRNIRHLPVVEEGDLLGVVSKRDLELSKFVCQSTKHCPALSDLVQTDPLVVLDSADVAEVAKEMANKKVEVALVADTNGNFVGIFTTSDACNLVHTILEELRLKGSDFAFVR